MAKKLALIAILAASLAAAPCRAQIVKVGSLAPISSPWDNHLRQLSATWARLSQGKVALKVYAGGVLGDEPDMIRKIRIGQLSAALITVSGLGLIHSSLITPAIPYMIQSDAELDYVLERIRPVHEAELEKRGFVALGWTKGGWIHFFSRRPIVTPDDLRDQKLWAWTDDAATVRAWQSRGFKVVVMPANDLLVGLQTGMVDALATSPLIAASNQLFGVAQHMSEMNFAPLYGALIISRTTWNRIPSDLRPRLQAAVADACRLMSREADALNAEALRIMRQHGLQTHTVPESARNEWQTLFLDGYQVLVGSVFDQAAFDLTTELIGEFRDQSSEQSNGRSDNSQ